MLDLNHEYNEQLMEEYINLARAANDIIGICSSSPIAEMHCDDGLMNMSLEQLREFACLQAGKLLTFIDTNKARWETHREFIARMDSFEREASKRSEEAEKGLDERRNGHA